MSFDVCIIGGGVLGAAVAYHAAAAGASVCLLDQASGPEPPTASWASAGGVRRQNRDPSQWGLSMEAAGRWPGLAAELEAATGFIASGHLHVAESPTELAELAARVRAEQAGGVDVELLDAAAAARIAPGLAETVLGAAFTAGDGQADPRATTRAFRLAAARHGAELRLGRADLVTKSDGSVGGVVAGGERIYAGTVVVAAGAWSARLAAGTLRLPIEAAALQMLLTAPVPPALGPTITAQGRRLSLKQRPDGAYLVGGGWPGVVSEDRCEVLAESVKASWETATALFPALAELGPPEHSWCGLEGQTPDGLPLIGRPLAVPGLYVCAAFCSHGFQLAPSVGRAVADDLLGGPRQELAAFSPDRFPAIVS
jgi:sarcosine oxidase subunit beta